MKKKLGALIILTVVLLPALSVHAGWSVSDLDSYGLPSGSVYNIITGILGWLLAIIGFIGVIGFLVAGAMYITAFGDEKKAGTAKSAMMGSIIGVIVALAGYVAIQAIDNLLNGSFF